MAINTYLQRFNLKNKLSKQEEQRQNHGYREDFDGFQRVEGCEGMGEEVRGKKHKSDFRHLAEAAGVPSPCSCLLSPLPRASQRTFW